MYSDRLIFQDVIKWSKNPEAKKIYNKIIEESERYLENFFKDPQKSMYFMTPDFKSQITTLEKLKLSDKEQIILDHINKSLEIYVNQSHEKRVQLLLHQLMKDYPKWSNSKNLFKYGANHLARGESFLTIHDIGNVVAIITRSNYQESFHIMIIGKSGMRGAPFEIFPPSPVNNEKRQLNSLKPFFDLVESENWYLFDMIPLRMALEKRKLQVDDITLQRTIKGYDILIIIPEVTAAGF